MKVTVNRNNDTLTINDDPVISWRIKDPNQMEKILEEIFNRLNYTKLADDAKHFDIQLELINEGRRTIDEW